MYQANRNNNSRFRSRDTYSSFRSKSSYSQTASNSRNIARAQDFSRGRYSGPGPEEGTSKWDVAPKGLEQYSAQQVKLAGVFSPGRKLSPAEIERVLAKLQLPSLDPENSALNRSLIIENFDDGYIRDLLSRLELSPKYTVAAGGLLYQFETPMHVAVLIACPGPLVLKRPPGLVTSDSGSIWSNHATRILDVSQASELARNGVTVETVQAKDGSPLAYFAKDTAQGRPLYPQLNNAPVVSQPGDFEQVPAKPSKTLVILNGLAPQVKALVESYSPLTVKVGGQRVPKVFAQFSCPQDAAKCGQELHLKQVGPQKLLVGYWDDEAFDSGIF